jgi:hypothetical protein
LSAAPRNQAKDYVWLLVPAQQDWAKFHPFGAFFLLGGIFSLKYGTNISGAISF